MYHSIRAAANVFFVPLSTLLHRLARRSSRPQAHESEQILSHVEEKTINVSKHSQNMKIFTSWHAGVDVDGR
jgi:hypothetical protein